MKYCGDCRFIDKETGTCQHPDRRSYKDRWTAELERTFGECSAKGNLWEGKCGQMD